MIDEQYELAGAMEDLQQTFVALQAASQRFSDIFNGELSRFKIDAAGLLAPVDLIETCVGDLTINPIEMRCFWKTKPVELTVTESKIVMAMAKRPDQVFTRDYLLDAFFPDVFDRTIDSHIKRIRRKFEACDPDFNKPEFRKIHTLYGTGYRWNL